MACTAVGGSHLVWSTRAGAEYGWSLVGLILLANLLKYPFFLYGQRYTAATGESLLAGYHRHGAGYVYTFLGINILTGIINTAGVAMLAGALFAGYGDMGLPVPQLTVLLLMVCASLLLVGQYKLLDGLSKVIIALLTVSTVLAVVLAMTRGGVAAPDFVAPSPYNWASFAFLVSLLGWMPAPIDLSAWSSLWMFSREKQTGHFATLREMSIDFYLGYIGAALLAVLFVALGRFVMFGSGEAFSESGIGFTDQLVNLYTGMIGEWSRPLIVTAAFFTMFSTSLTVVDGYPRSLAACCAILWDLPPRRFHQIRQIWILMSVIAASIVVLLFVQSLIQLLTFAAVISFLTSPVLAYINFKVMNGPNVPVKDRPSFVLKLLSWSGLGFFLLMTLGYVYVVSFRAG